MAQYQYIYIVLDWIPHKLSLIFLKSEVNEFGCDFILWCNSCFPSDQEKKFAENFSWNKAFTILYISKFWDWEIGAKPHFSINFNWNCQLDCPQREGVLATLEKLCNIMNIHFVCDYINREFLILIFLHGHKDWNTVGGEKIHKILIIYWKIFSKFIMELQTWICKLIWCFLWLLLHIILMNI